jgi:hypothetical protein
MDISISSFDNEYRRAVKARNLACNNLRTAIDQENEESPFLDQARKLAIETDKALKKASNSLQLALLLQSYNNRMEKLTEQ